VYAPRAVARGVTEARVWLRAHLADGPQLTVNVIQDGALAGFNARTLERARVGIARARKVGKGWTMELLP